jgi:hypothetical protein
VAANQTLTIDVHSPSVHLSDADPLRRGGM